MSVLTIIIIAISLSMDAFSLSLAYGTLNLEKHDIYLLSILVGIFHFFMPLIGYFIGNKIISLIWIKENFIVFLVLVIIGFNMIIESFKDNNNVSKMNILEMIIFSFAVSIDSFSVGIGIKKIYDNNIVSSLLFSLSAGMFTYFGLKLGKTINNAIGKISTIIGGIVLIIIGILYI